jgi:Mrp family chromosome partitioning ATPase
LRTEDDSRNLDVLRALRQRVLLILGCVILSAAVAFALSERQHKRYTATASIYFRSLQADQAAAGVPSSQFDQQSQTDTNLKLATLPRIAAATAAAVGPAVTAAGVAANVSVAQQGDSNLATVSATSSTPALAATVANTYAQQIVADHTRTNQSYYQQALRAVNLEYQTLQPLQKLNLTGAALLDRASALQVLAQFQASEVQVAQPAGVPTSPSSPKVVRNTVLGGLLGLLLGLALAMLLARVDRRLRDPADLPEVYGAPLIAVIPHSARLKQRSPRGLAKMPGPAEAEVFSLLRARIRYFNVDRQVRTVLITSAEAGEGKTTVAMNLAFAAAEVGSRVLLVECDLRRPTVARHLGVEPSQGISDVLLGERPLEEAIQRVDLPAPANGHVASAGSEAADKSHLEHLDVLVAGGVLPPNPAQVIESYAMDSLLLRAKGAYDLVVIDAPPLAAVSDAFPLLGQADGVVVVSRLRRARRDVAARLRQTLESANAPLIGIVANDYRRRPGSTGRYDRTSPLAAVQLSSVEAATDGTARPLSRQ